MKCNIRFIDIATTIGILILILKLYSLNQLEFSSIFPLLGFSLKIQSVFISPLLVEQLNLILHTLNWEY
ncbi:hypothetical protein NIES4101_64100 [Calothrix sp. NIES-4101]|nr:hypothetical protein NIES4101_64100 [Calothrix sp. NIES-4101]